MKHLRNVFMCSFFSEISAYMYVKATRMFGCRLFLGRLGSDFMAIAGFHVRAAQGPVFFLP